MPAIFTHRIRILVSLSAWALFQLGSPAKAQAQTRLALDLDYAAGIGEGGIASGTGGAVRLGRELDLVVLSLTPEIGGSYHTFAGTRDASHYAGFAGGRVAFGKLIEPGAFAHIGIGRLDARPRAETGPAVDVGLSLDFTLLPVLDLGIHAAYHALILDDGRSFDWLRLGAHVALAF